MDFFDLSLIQSHYFSVARQVAETFHPHPAFCAHVTDVEILSVVDAPAKSTK
jgi:hypothetical protein